MMLHFHVEASREYHSALDWHAERSVEAAIRLEQEVDRTLERIAADPESLAVIDSAYRAASVRDFPFRIVYRLNSPLVLIVAVAHTRRRSRYWGRRAN